MCGLLQLFLQPPACGIYVYIHTKILMAPVEHVQLFKVRYFRQKKWYTEPVSQLAGLHMTTYC